MHNTSVLENLSIEELKEFFGMLSEKSFRAKQYFQAIHKNRILNPENMTNFSIELREKLNKYNGIKNCSIAKRLDSNVDNTKKYLIQLSDDNIVETVFMEYKTHTSICISTQIGCKMGCKFCASTKKSFVRNLEAYEMCAQIYLVENDLGKRINNIVLMGIGEPLDNYDNVVRFINLITNKDGQDMSIRNITLSTCGLVDKIKKLADDDIGINITISLHNPFDEQRSLLMPIGNKYPIDDILDACDYYFKKTKRRIGFEYTVIENINDSKKYMDKLVGLLKSRNCLLNLITLNPIEEFNQKSPNKEKMNDFMNYMINNKVNTTIRRKQGIDIDGACGQLRINNMIKRGVKWNMLQKQTLE